MIIGFLPLTMGLGGAEQGAVGGGARWLLGIESYLTPRVALRLCAIIGVTVGTLNVTCSRSFASSPSSCMKYKGQQRNTRRVTSLPAPSL